MGSGLKLNLPTGNNFIDSSKNTRNPKVSARSWDSGVVLWFILNRYSTSAKT